MVTKEIKDAIQDVLNARIDSHNYGMLGNYRMSFDSHKIVRNGKIEIPTDLYGTKDIKQNGVKIGEVIFRYASKKVNGMYKLLKPKFVWS